MTLKEKKIRKESRRHKLDRIDLENAVESVERHRAGQYIEADIYRKAVQTSTRRLWETAEYIVKFLGEVDEQ